MGSVIRSSCARASPCGVWFASKKWRMKMRTALGSEVGRKGSRRNGWSRAVFLVQICQPRACLHYLEASPQFVQSNYNNCAGAKLLGVLYRTSRLEFHRAVLDQSSDLLGLYCCSRICVALPARFRVGVIGEVVEAALLFRFGFTLAIFAPYPREETRHGDTGLMQWYPSE